MTNKASHKWSKRSNVWLNYLGSQHIINFFECKRLVNNYVSIIFFQIKQNFAKESIKMEKFQELAFSSNDLKERQRLNSKRISDKRNNEILTIAVTNGLSGCGTGP